MARNKGFILISDMEAKEIAPRGWKARERFSEIYECEAKTWRCLGKYIKTLGKDQEQCLNCTRELASPALPTAVRKVGIESNGNSFLNKNSHFAVIPVSTTGGSVESGGCEG